MAYTESTKRYYWLKLHKDFFDQKQIKALRRYAGGDRLIIIFLKMQLKSIKSAGSKNAQKMEKHSITSYISMLAVKAAVPSEYAVFGRRIGFNSKKRYNVTRL